MTCAYLDSTDATMPASTAARRIVCLAASDHAAGIERAQVTSSEVKLPGYDA